MNFEYMVAFLSGDKSKADKIGANQLVTLNVVRVRQYLTGQVEN